MPKSTLHWIKRCLAGITKCQRHHSCEISVSAIRINHAVGSSRILSIESEERKREFRRSIVTTRSIVRGEVFGKKDLTFKRPGTGLSPEFVDLVIGRVAKRDLKKDQVLSDADF